MPRNSFVWKDGQFVQGESRTRTKHLSGDEMVGGIEHPANGEICYSKSRYKAISKEHDLEEAYGEPEKYFRKRDTSEQDAQDLEEDVTESLAKLNYGEGISEEDLELCRQRNERIKWQSEQ